MRTPPSCAPQHCCVQAQYLEKLVLLDAQRMLSGGKAGLSLLLPGFMGVQLHSKGSDGKREDKLLSDIATLEIGLRIPIGMLVLGLGQPAFLGQQWAGNGHAGQACLVSIRKVASLAEFPGCCTLKTFIHWL